MKTPRRNNLEDFTVAPSLQILKSVAIAKLIVIHSRAIV
jgi:hypothetical protein